MLRIICIAVLFLTCSVKSVQAQVHPTNWERTQEYKKIPQEGIYIHHNNNLLFSGERLYYKLYCINLESKGLSQLSKIAYVSLIGAEGETVLSQKVKLTAGTGYGDFQIPAEISTGSYKLVAYSKWMQSRNEKQFLESDLLIINPYKSTPGEFLLSSTIDSVDNDSLAVKPEIITASPLIRKENIGDQLLALEVENEAAAVRSQFNLKIKALQPAVVDGNYSISVRKIDSTLPSIGDPPISYWRDLTTGNAKLSASQPMLPELRGELISGYVETESAGEPAEGVKVAISLPGEPYILDIAQTDKDGRFYMNLDTPVNTRQAIFQLLGDARENYIIKFEEHQLPDFNGLDYPSFTLNKTQESVILERSIHNQIENAYAQVKSDAVEVAEESVPFYRDYQSVFYLDDYTRFNTLRETMVEIVDHAWIEENGDEDPTFAVRPFDGYLNANGLYPMVFMDGLFIQDHKDIVDYNSKEIHSIYVSRDRYMMGPNVYQGLVSIKTNSGAFPESFYRWFLVNEEISRPVQGRNYFFQKYQESDEAERLPDFRYQLYWEPLFTMTGESTDLSFYTSDIKGLFEIELKGFSAQGDPISVVEYITVE